MPNVIFYLTDAARDPNTLLTTVLLPFLIIFVILWGVLNITKIFGTGPESKKINIILALGITIFAAFTDAWGIFATQLAAFTGVFVYIMFFVVFIIGTILWAIGRTRGIYEEHGTYFKSYKDVVKIDKELGKLTKKFNELRRQGKDEQASHVYQTIAKLKERKDQLIFEQQQRR